MCQVVLVSIHFKGLYEAMDSGAFFKAHLIYNRQFTSCFNYSSDIHSFICHLTYVSHFEQTSYICVVIGVFPATDGWRQEETADLTDEKSVQHPPTHQHIRHHQQPHRRERGVNPRTERRKREDKGVE